MYAFVISCLLLATIEMFMLNNMNIDAETLMMSKCKKYFLIHLCRAERYWENIANNKIYVCVFYLLMQILAINVLGYFICSCFCKT